MKSFRDGEGTPRYVGPSTLATPADLTFQRDTKVEEERGQGGGQGDRAVPDEGGIGPSPENVECFSLFCKYIFLYFFFVFASFSDMGRGGPPR